MKKACLYLAGMIAAIGLSVAAVALWITFTMPEYPKVLGSSLEPQKILGTWLQAATAENEDALIIFGSSELKTTEIVTHPANVFAGEPNGFYVDLIGRGSCQSLVHAMAIAASGDALQGKRVVLITAPQSYVEDGIAPDLFMGNFSELQVLRLLRDESLSEESRRYLATRIRQLITAYNSQNGTSLQQSTAAGLLSAAVSGGSGVKKLLLQPYAAVSEWLLSLKDMADSARVIRSADAEPAEERELDWDAVLEAAMQQAGEMSTNNEFYMQDSYFSTYIGHKLAQQAGREASLSYSQSPEYDDLRCLLQICEEKDVDVLFVHVPVNGTWSDYTGFTAEKREEYYTQVRKIVQEYETVTLLDLTGYEYEPYFMCDTMHLGWKGWLEVDKALDRFWNED